MPQVKELLEKNKQWAASVKEQDPQFFDRLKQQQTPEYLWIGCSDSRVPANQIVNLLPGDLFVHRNVANMVVHTDLNCLSVMQYAVDVLKVKHIIVTGHYGCGGVRASIEEQRFGLIDNWLRHIQDVYKKHQKEMQQFEDFDVTCDRLCELNVIEQVMNVVSTSVIQEAWDRGQNLSVHGWIYGIDNGLVNDLDITIRGLEGSNDIYDKALAKILNTKA
ncbi:carbonate dehydratase [Litoribrevibacter albus]|uniref:Carbonic anhydrase n=1 Tax=Litoribrevibacter albus TaxID=1473156 RepID=A0AA37S9Z6_9GAMM|nr:carbonate dehydratase [Litoribrevibacter albus]GLQ32017.1 carbonic anhydrase [Litoribrevibacter albus]